MTPARPFPTSGSAREAIQWPRCQTRKRSNGKTDFYHSMLAATLVAPGHNMVVPLTPEFIVKPDGAEKQDCERNAAEHWLAAHAAPRLSRRLPAVPRSRAGERRRLPVHGQGAPPRDGAGAPRSIGSASPSATPKGKRPTTGPSSPRSRSLPLHQNPRRRGWQGPPGAQ